MEGSPRSVGSTDTVIRQGGVSRVLGENGNVVLFYDPSRAVVAEDVVVLGQVGRSGVPRARSVDTLPRYEEVEGGDGWKTQRLSGGVGRAV